MRHVPSEAQRASSKQASSKQAFAIAEVPCTPRPLEVRRRCRSKSPAYREAHSAPFRDRPRRCVLGDASPMSPPWGAISRNNSKSRSRSRSRKLTIKEQPTRRLRSKSPARVFAVAAERPSLEKVVNRRRRSKSPVATRVCTEAVEMSLCRTASRDAIGKGRERSIQRNAEEAPRRDLAMPFAPPRACAPPAILSLSQRLAALRGATAPQLSSSNTTAVGARPSRKRSTSRVNERHVMDTDSHRGKTQHPSQIRVAKENVATAAVLTRCAQTSQKPCPSHVLSGARTYARAGRGGA